MFLETLRKKKGVLRKVRNSIRTRYSLATGFFLLMILGLFYVGGRIVLVHLVKDAEKQVQAIGSDSIWLAAAIPALILASAVCAPIFLGVAK